MYIFAYINCILVNHCTNGKNTPPWSGFEPGPHHWQLTDITTAPQGLKEALNLWIYILYFASCLVFGTWNMVGSNPTLSTTPNITQVTELLRPLPRPWVWQISKSANCKLHQQTYLYMYRGRWLVSAIYSRHWRLLYHLWWHIPAHAPGHL